MQEEHLPKQHELLRQCHAITHVFVLLEGSVEVSAITAVSDEARLHPDTLVDTRGGGAPAPASALSLPTHTSTFELPGAASLSAMRTLDTGGSLLLAGSLQSDGSCAGAQKVCACGNTL